MRDLLILLVHLITTTARLMGPGGARSVIAESLLVKHQLLILNRSRQRAPNLRASDRLLAGVCSLFIRPTRVVRSAIVAQTVNDPGLPSALADTQVPRTVLTDAPRPTRSQGSVPRVGGRHCRNEEAKSEMGVSADGAADRTGLRGPDRQGRRAACARHALSTGIDLERPVMADVLGACERPPVEHRPVPMRVSHAAQPLGAGGHGPVHATDRRLRHPRRRCGWPGPGLHVQPCHSRASDAAIPQRRQRSPVPVLPVAQPTCACYT